MGTRYGGRKKGTPNKVTQTMREKIKDILDNYVDSGLMDSDLQKVKPVERLMIAEKLMQYSIPKLQSVEAEISVEGQKTIEDTLVELSKANDK